MRFPPAIPLLFALALPAFAAEDPQALLLGAKKAMDGHAWKSVRLTGIIAGKDFDLTIETPAGEERQIAVGDNAWTSPDEGKTWKKGDAANRRYYDLVHGPINYDANEQIPPFERVDSKPEAGGETLERIKFVSENKEQYIGDRPNYWLTLRDEKPTAIRRYHGPLTLDNAYVTANIRYTALPAKQAVLPPPGNPLALPSADRPEILLSAALKNMVSKRWEVKAKVSSTKSARSTDIHGIIQGADFDLTMDPGAGKPLIRQIAIKDKSWASMDGGSQWKSADIRDRAAYDWIVAPIAADRMRPPFEKIGVESHGTESWLHLRMVLTENAIAGAAPAEYWLLLDKAGKPASVRHYTGALYFQGAVLQCETDYSAPGDKDEIKPPPGS
jgi:hypothetical protein